MENNSSEVKGPSSALTCKPSNPLTSVWLHECKREQNLGQGDQEQCIRVSYPFKGRNNPSLLSLEPGLFEARYCGGCGLIREHVTESKACWAEAKQDKRQVAVSQ